MQKSQQSDERLQQARGDEHPSVKRGPALEGFIRRTAVALLLVAVVGLLGSLFVLGIDVLLAAFGGLLVAIFLRACTDLVRRYSRLPDGWALMLAVFVLLVLFGTVGWLLAPQISDQLNQLGERVPRIVGQVEDFLQDRNWGQWVLDQLRVQAEDGAAGEQITGQVGGFFSSFSQWSTYALTAIFVGLFGAANPRLYTRGIVNLTPLRHRKRVSDLIQGIGHTLRWWLIGQALAMLVIGVSTTIVLLVFGVPMALVLGIIVGFLGFIPYLGPIIGAVPVAAIAALEGTSTLAYVMIAYTVVQVLEGYIATPLIQRQTVYLPPVFTIISQILLGTVLGMLGFIFATPLAAVALVISRFYRTDILGDREAAKG